MTSSAAFSVALIPVCCPHNTQTDDFFGSVLSWDAFVEAFTPPRDDQVSSLGEFGSVWKKQVLVVPAGSDTYTPESRLISAHPATWACYRS